MQGSGGESTSAAGGDAGSREDTQLDEGEWEEEEEEEEEGATSHQESGSGGRGGFGGIVIGSVEVSSREHLYTVKFLYTQKVFYVLSIVTKKKKLAKAQPKSSNFQCAQ